FEFRQDEGVDRSFDPSAISDRGLLRLSNLLISPVIELFGGERKIIRECPDAAGERQNGKHSFQWFRVAHNFSPRTEGFYFTETAAAVILMPVLPYVNQYRERWRAMFDQ